MPDTSSTEMKQAIEQPSGNYYDKYHSNNIIVQKMMSGFFSAYNQLLTPICSDGCTILEAGCGEGEVTNYLYKNIKHAQIDAFDISDEVIETAQQRTGNTPIHFSVNSIYDFPTDKKYDLVVCSEVLEHLEYPEKALARIKSVSNGYMICSVPREPIWRILNIARGKYIKAFGNTPGHINHWSKRSFIAFLRNNDCKVIGIRSPLPWTVVLIKI